jgi:3-isopropylmalate/(R)-2-methylmalate dehydratase small subunit
MMKFTKLKGLVLPLDRANVDTDMIIPKQFLKSIKRSGFGVNLFDELRYKDEGYIGQDISKRSVNESFVLNKERYKGAEILIARENFGCGSSREHAPWALQDYGFKCIIAPSFADIFFNNCFKNGLLPIVLSEDNVESLFNNVEKYAGYTLNVDLEKQVITDDNELNVSFDVDQFRKYCLLNGFDDIGLTLKDKSDIEAFEVEYKQKSPWLFDRW